MNLDQNIFFIFKSFWGCITWGKHNFSFKIVPISFIILGQNIRNYHKLHHMNWFKRTLLPNSRWTKFLGFFTPLEGLIQVLEPQYVQPPSYLPFLAKNWIITLASLYQSLLEYLFSRLEVHFKSSPSTVANQVWHERAVIAQLGER